MVHDLRTWRKIVIALMTTSLGMASAQEASHFIRSGIDVVVVDNEGNGIAKANVAIVDSGGDKVADGMTDRFGRFSVSQVPPGAYQIEVRGTGYRGTERTLLVQESFLSELRIALEKVPEAAPRIVDTLQHGTSSVSVVVQDPNGAVIQGMTLSVNQTATGTLIQGRTGPSGQYSLANLGTGRYTIVAEHSGFAEQKISVDLGPGEARQVRIVMQLGHPGPDIFSDPEQPMLEPIVSTAQPESIPQPRADVLATGGPTDRARTPSPKPQPGRVKRFFSAVGRKLGF